MTAGYISAVMYEAAEKCLFLQMARQTIDGVIEAVRYTPEGRLALVRAYERRGPTYSDWILINRESLIERLKAGQKFMLGTRRSLMASTFDLTMPIHLVRKPGKDDHNNIYPFENGDHVSGIRLF